MEILSIHIYQITLNPTGSTDPYYKLLYNAYHLPDQYIFMFIKDKNNINDIIKTVSIELVNLHNPIDGDKKIISCEKFRIFIYRCGEKVITITFIGTEKDYVLLSMVKTIIDKMGKENISSINELLNSREVDKIGYINKDLEYIKAQMSENIVKLNMRGDKLEDLLIKSEVLSKESQIFMKESKKLRKWCCGLI